MKKNVLALVLCLVSVSAIAQNDNRPPRKSTKKHSHRTRPNLCPGLYVSGSSGINNNTGIAGVGLELPIEKYIALEAGGGISSWGTKAYLGGKCYLQPCQQGWAFGTGFTYNTGVSNFKSNLETVKGKQDVKLNLVPQTNVLFAVYHYWSIGRHYNRFFAELGWSLSLNNSIKYEIVEGDALTNDAKKSFLRMKTPGGPIAAVGISFGLF